MGPISLFTYQQLRTKAQYNVSISSPHSSVVGNIKPHVDSFEFSSKENHMGPLMMIILSREHESAKTDLAIHLQFCVRTFMYLVPIIWNVPSLLSPTRLSDVRSRVIIRKSTNTCTFQSSQIRTRRPIAYQSYSHSKPPFNSWHLQNILCFWTCSPKLVNNVVTRFKLFLN